jgi:hypothetical protein
VVRIRRWATSSRVFRRIFARRDRSRRVSSEPRRGSGCGDPLAAVELDDRRQWRSGFNGGRWGRLFIQQWRTDVPFLGVWHRGERLVPRDLRRLPLPRSSPPRPTSSNWRCWHRRSSTANPKWSGMECFGQDLLRGISPRGFDVRIASTNGPHGSGCGHSLLKPGLPPNSQPTPAPCRIRRVIDSGPASHVSSGTTTVHGAMGDYGPDRSTKGLGQAPGSLGGTWAS